MRLHFSEQGSGLPLILLHGLFGSLDNWASVSRSLSDRFHVFSLDQRNHGQSPHSDEMDYDALAADLDEFILEHSLSEVRILGHSMGAKTAMHYALQHPDRVARLVVVDMAPRAYAPAHDRIFEALQAVDLSRFENRTQLESALAPQIPDLAVRRFLMKGVRRSDGTGLAWQFNLPVLKNNYGRLLAALESPRPFPHPTLFIRGAKSPYIRDDDADGLRRLFPRAEIVTIESAGHWVHAEAPDAFLDAVRTFLEDRT